MIRDAFYFVEYLCLIYDIFLEALLMNFEALVCYRCQLVKSPLVHGPPERSIFHLKYPSLTSYPSSSKCY